MPELFTAPLKDGAAFVAHNRLEPNIDFLRGMPEEDFSGWFASQFRAAYDAKRPETERLKLNELYYSGFHYITPEMNREMKVTNLCFSTVETVHPVMTEMRPRPEIIPRRQYQQEDVTKLQEYAQWLMDTTEFDLDHHVNTREKLKQGWCVHILVPDPKTGIFWPKPFSVYDFYPDPSARHEDEMEFFFLAQPVPTSWLREQYPDKADLIVSDNICSPSYDVLQKPYFEAYNFGGDYNGLDAIVAGSAHLEADPDPGSGRSLVPADFGVKDGNGTTFLIQGFFRDRRMMEVHYTGDIATKNGDGMTFTHTPSALNYRRNEPYAESGWVSVPMTAGGLRLGGGPVDPCFLGIPIEIGRNYAQVGRFYCPGEQDHIIPINRSINQRYSMLNRSLQYESVPILVADTDTGIDIDQRAVEPGDVLKKVRGSTIQWMEFRGAQAQQFNLLSLEQRDMDTVSGVHDVQQGRRPEGIEAAAAIRNLQNAAQTRIRGKEGPAFTEYTRLLKKMMYATGKKAKQDIYFRGSNGQLVALDPAMLCYEYDIRFAQGSGTALGRAMNEEKYQGLYQMGLVDQQTALEKMGVPNIPVIVNRLAAQQAIQAEAAAAASAKQPGGAAA